ncbi:MAG: type II secretion system F family protein [archaeon]
MELEKKHILGMVFAFIILTVNLLFLRDEKIFYFVIGISALIAALPFVVTLTLESTKDRENDEMFLEFSRNLVESVRSGTPVSKSIINVGDKNYGSLTPHVKKLANQISLGIPVKDSLEIFARDVGSPTVSRAVTLISEAEQAGGSIDVILEAVAKSVATSEKLKKERKAAIYSLVVQGYIIFFVFVVIMLIMQYKILAMTAGIAGYAQGFGGGSSFEIEEIGLGGGNVSPEQFSLPFLMLLVAQGLFAGIIIGKLSEGSIKAGLKHSFVFVILSVLISTGANVFFG